MECAGFGKLFAGLGIARLHPQLLFVAADSERERAFRRAIFLCSVVCGVVGLGVVGLWFKKQTKTK